MGVISAIVKVCVDQLKSVNIVEVHKWPLHKLNLTV